MKLHFILILLSFLFVHPLVFGQEQDEGGEIEDAQIIIEKDKPLTLPKASRIYKRTKIKSIGNESQKLDYNISQPSFQFESYDLQITPESYDDGGKTQMGIYQNYAKVGFGNYLSPLFQGYLGISEEGDHAGLWLNHESFARGPVRDEESAYGLTELLLNGHVQRGVFGLDPEIYFQREGYYAYGYEEPQAADFEAPGKIGASTFSFVPQFQLNPSDQVEVVVRPFIENTRMKYAEKDPFNKEAVLGVEAAGEFMVNEELGLGLETGIKHLSYKTDFDQKRNVFHLNPYGDYKNDLFYFHGGIKLVSAGGDSVASRFVLYPDLRAKLQFGPQFGIFAILKGDLQPVALNDVRLQNRYLSDSLRLLNTHTPLDFDGGIEVNIAEKLLIKGLIGYSVSSNYAFFRHSMLDTARFDLVYETKGFGQFNFGGEARYVSGPTNVSLGAQVFGYSVDEVAEAWYLPTYSVELAATQTILEKLHLDLGLKVMGGIKAPAPISQDVVKLDPIADLGFTTQYDFTTHLSAFIQFRNMFSKNFERYLNYPSRGFMTKAGFIYRF